MNKFIDILTNPIIKKIYNDSKANALPILREKTTMFLLDIIKKHKIKSCLEIGTAFGFSASVMGIVANIDVVTIERDPIRNMKAKTYLSSVKNIECVLDDCFNYETDKKFDLLLLDGPKTKQDLLLEKLENNLTKNGIVFIDNIFLKVFSELKDPTPNQIKILESVEQFKNYLQNNSKYKCTIYDIEDGVAILERK